MKGIRFKPVLLTNHRLMAWYQRVLNKRALFHFSMMTISLFMAPAAHAGSDISAITNALQGLLDILSGTTARLICAIAVVGMGYLWISGRMSLANAIKITVGVGLILGAPDIVDLLM